MCGIFGYVSNELSKVNVDAFKILGILNETRGENSCGITMDSEIFHGVEYKDKKFRDFLKGITIKPELKPVLIGHTRKSSVGVVNIHNAHPFGFGTNKDNSGYKFIGVHNGTLHNYEELAKEFNIELEIQENTTTKRKKIDSEVLLESIFRSESLKPLSFYNGGAALAWYSPDTDTVCLFSGESKSYEHSQITSIERPLHVWLVDDNTFAFSSEEDPLLVIGALKEDVFQIETNTVYIIKNGDFKNAKKLKISRNNNVNKKEVASYYNGEHTSRRLHEQRTILPAQTSQNAAQARTQTSNQTIEKTQSSSAENTSRSLSIPTKPSSLVTSNYTSKTPVNNYMEKFVLDNQYNGRYYLRDFKLMRNGHIATDGVYCYINCHGYFYLGKDVEEAITTFKKYKDCYFDIVDCMIVNEINNKLKNTKYSDKRFIKFPLLNKPSDFTYVFKGYILDTVMDFASTLENPHWYITSNIVNFITMSHITRYPVLCKAGSSEYWNKFIKEGKEYSGTVFGPSFESSCVIKEGILQLQTEIYRYCLTGLDLSNLIKYEERLERYNEKQKELNDISKLNTYETRNYLKSFKDAELINFEEEVGYGEIQKLAEEAIKLFNDYEDDCFSTRQDVGLDMFFLELNNKCHHLKLFLDDIVFDLVSILQSNIKKSEALTHKELINNNTIRSVITVLMNREKTY